MSCATNTVKSWISKGGLLTSTWYIYRSKGGNVEVDFLLLYVTFLSNAQRSLVRRVHGLQKPFERERTAVGLLSRVYTLMLQEIRLLPRCVPVIAGLSRAGE